MLNFSFLLDDTQSGSTWWIYIPFILIIVAMFWFSGRSQRKQEKEHAAMRDALAVGDEVTTIGGIIGKVVSVKDETFVLETTKDRTKIRFLKGAIRTVDVKIADIVAAQKAEKEAQEAEKAEQEVQEAEKPETEATEETK